MSAAGSVTLRACARHSRACARRTPAPFLDKALAACLRTPQPRLPASAPATCARSSARPFLPAGSTRRGRLSPDAPTPCHAPAQPVPLSTPQHAPGWRHGQAGWCRCWGLLGGGCWRPRRGAGRGTPGPRAAAGAVMEGRGRGGRRRRPRSAVRRSGSPAHMRARARVHESACQLR